MESRLLFVLGMIGMLLSDYLYAQYEDFEIFDEDDAMIIDHLKMLEEHPLDINTVTREGLAIFPFLNEMQIDTLLSNRPYRHLSEVASIISPDIFQALAPFITIKKRYRTPKGNVTTRLCAIPENMRGYREKYYLGSKYDLYGRIRFAMGDDITCGLLSHKDAGERSATDHYTGFVQWDSGHHRLIAGTYTLHYGEGLALSHGWYGGRSSYPIAPLKTTKWTGKSFLSSSENKGFAGIFWETIWGSRLILSGFYSHTLLDAIPADNRAGVTGLDRDGYHRTETEANRKDLLLKTAYGGSMVLRLNSRSRVGLSHIRSNYKPDFICDKQQYELFNVLHNRVNISSLYYDISLMHITMSGELALSSTRSIAQQYGFVLSDDKWSLGGKWWHIPNSYHAPDGQAFLNAAPAPHGIQGYYCGISGSVASGITFNGYWQIENRLWRSYFSELPTQKKWYFLQLAIRIDRETDIALHYRHALTELSRHALRFQYDKKISSRLSLQGRFENVFETLAHKEGINLYQDLKIRLLTAIYLQARYSSFQTADYDVRIYEYENDLPGCYSMYALYGRGNKCYLILRWQPAEFLTIWLKYRRLYFDGVETIGTGFAEIQGDIRRDIRVQVQFSF
jgi:hypothetical protein